jgi:hypothetical protein
MRINTQRNSLKSFRKTLTLFSGLLVFGLANMTAQYVNDPVCQGFQGTSRSEAVDYLRQDRTALEPICIENALRILAKRRSGPSNATEREILVKYIDFKVERVGVPLSGRVGPTSKEYIAADALVDYGKLVIPDLKAILINDDASKRSRVNAAKVYFWMAPNAPTIAYISKAGRNAGDPEAGDELTHLASLMVRGCAKDEQDACRNALGN